MSGSSGRKKGTAIIGGKENRGKKANPPDGPKEKTTEETLSPLAYMMKVINDPAEDAAVRRQMAVAAAPFCHARKGEGAGKKEEKSERAKAAATGKFAAGKPPAKILPFKKGTDEL